MKNDKWSSTNHQDEVVFADEEDDELVFADAC